jgi:hypothetical protein
MSNDRLKYPRTYHLPWSLGVHSDDKIIKTPNQFEGMEIVCTEKMDGESTSMYQDYMHARSVSSAHNFTRDWAKKMQSILANDIPKNWIFSFENLAYVHSIEYNNLESFCYLLSIWDDKGNCLSYDEQCQWADILELAQPKVFYRGIYDENILKNLVNELDLNHIEGYVIRNTASFHRDNFTKNIGKFVRFGHVQPNHTVEDNEAEVEHWLKNTYPNKLLNPQIVKPSYMSQSIHKNKF